MEQGQAGRPEDSVQAQGKIWAIGVRLELQGRVRDLALFNLGIDSKLRACDLVQLRVRDVSNGERAAARAKVMQQKTGQPVQFELTAPTRLAVEAWIAAAHLKAGDFLFPSRIHESPHIGARQYARIVDSWVEEIGFDSSAYGTHSMRQTKPSLIYRRTRNLRAVQLLLGHKPTFAGQAELARNRPGPQLGRESWNGYCKVLRDRRLQALSLATQRAPGRVRTPGVCAAAVRANRPPELCPERPLQPLFAACRLSDGKMGQLVTLEQEDDIARFKAKFVPD